MFAGLLVPYSPSNFSVIHATINADILPSVMFSLSPMEGNFIQRLLVSDTNRPFQSCYISPLHPLFSGQEAMYNLFKRSVVVPTDSHQGLTHGLF